MQLLNIVNQRTHNPLVVGSNPTGPTIEDKRLINIVGLYILYRPPLLDPYYPIYDSFTPITKVGGGI